MARGCVMIMTLILISISCMPTGQDAFFQSSRCYFAFSNVLLSCLGQNAKVLAGCNPVIHPMLKSFGQYFTLPFLFASRQRQSFLPHFICEGTMYQDVLDCLFITSAKSTKTWPFILSWIIDFDYSLRSLFIFGYVIGCVVSRRVK